MKTFYLVGYEVRPAFLPQPGVSVVEFPDANSALKHLKKDQKAGKAVKIDMLFVKVSESEPADAFQKHMINVARELDRSTFILVDSGRRATELAEERLMYYNTYGVNAVSGSESAIQTMALDILKQGSGGGRFACPYCGLSGLDEDELVLHMPLYHCNEQNIQGVCPICNKMQENVYTHTHWRHGPAARAGHRDRPNLGLAAFALVVCRRPSDGKFLVVQEFCNSGLWLPGGGVDAREDLKTAAERETMEEAGVEVDIKGILRFEWSPHRDYVRFRVIFYAEPKDEANCMPKSIPDYESVGASWISLEEMQHLHMTSPQSFRGPEPIEWFPYVNAGGPIVPLYFLTPEGMRAPRVVPRDQAE